MDQMQRELQSLTDRLAALRTSSRRKGGKKKSTKSPVQSGSQAGFSSVASGSGKKKKRGSRGVNPSLGQITFSRRELLQDVVGPTSASSSDTAVTTVKIVPVSFTFLKQFTMFDRIKWNKLHVIYKPAVGSMRDGMVIYGFQWDFFGSAKSKADVSALTPNQSHSVWMDGETRPLIAPVAKLQMKPWYMPGDTMDAAELGPGNLVYSVTDPDKKGTTLGEFWADYSVTLTGTTF